MRRLFAEALMAMGALITFLSGACTGFFLFLRLGSMSRGGSIELVLPNLAIGLPFIVLGLALFFLGRAISRR